MHPQPDLISIHHRTCLGDWLNARNLTGIGVEVGTLYGAFATDILRTWQGHLYCVDPWINQDPAIYFDGANKQDLNHVYAQARAGIGRHPRCTLMRMLSLNAVGRFDDGELDFIYADGNHSVDSVRQDLLCWWPKVKIGGLVCGHDFFTRYDNDTNSDAATAVMELAEMIGIRPHVVWDSSWFFVKTEEADQKFRAWNLGQHGITAPAMRVYTDNTNL